MSYAARHPGRLVLVTPTPFVVGLEIADADRREVAELRRGEPWFPDAFAALERPPTRRAAELVVQPAAGHVPGWTTRRRSPGP